MPRHRLHLNSTLTRLAVALSLLLALAACNKSVATKHEFMWVSAPQANLRDKLATLYNKTAVLKNGDRVEVLEKQKRFVRVRSSSGNEGWVELRYLVASDVFDGFQKLSTEAAALPAQGHAATRATLNMHLTPSRDADALYQLHDTEKVEVLRRAVAEKLQPGVRKPAGSARVPANTATTSPTPQLTPTSTKPEKPEASDAPPPVLEDWWLVRSSDGHAGWVLGRMLDLDVPLEIAQYAEGQRIVGCFVLNQVQDEDKKVSQYLTLITEPHDGSPYDFDQVRVFTWNTKRHRYETGYRERKLYGVLPVKVSTQDFGKEGVLPVFTIRAQDDGGQTGERTYRLIGPIVRRVLPVDQQAETKAASHTAAPKTGARPVAARQARSKRRRR